MSVVERERAEVNGSHLLEFSRHVPFARAEISPEACDAVARVLSSGWLTTGPEVAEFEKEFATWVGAEHAVAVSSCTAAIELSLRALRLPAGAKVLTSTMTFCGAVHAIAHAGLRPVLVDVDADTLMPGPREVAEAAGRAGGADAMVVLHFAGYPAPVEEMAEAAQLPLDRVIEDAAHAIETSVGDKPVGTISAATCFSFYATKNLPIGEGGMITSKDPNLVDYVRRARLHGMSRDAWRRYLPGSAWRYSVGMPGLKANMTDVQAAIGRAHLLRLPTWQARRAEIARRYDQLLSDIPGLKTPDWPAEGRHAWHLYVLRIQQEFGIDRDDFIAALAERGVDCSVHFIPIHHQPHFQSSLGVDVAHFPVADSVFREIVSLPLHPGVADDDIDHVCEAVAAVRKSIRAHPAGPAGDADLRRARCLILGAGPSGRTIATELKPLADVGLLPIGFLEDGRSRKRVVGLPVLGRTSDLIQVLSEHAVDVVIVALPTLPRREILRLGDAAVAAGVSVRYLPASANGAGREPRIGDLRLFRSNGGSGGKRLGNGKAGRKPRRAVHALPDIVSSAPAGKA